MSHGIHVTASNIKTFDNYVLYRIWNEATTKKERSLAMKEIKRRQREGNMVASHSYNRGNAATIKSKHYKAVFSHIVDGRNVYKVYNLNSEIPIYQTVPLLKSEAKAMIDRIERQYDNDGIAR